MVSFDIKVENKNHYLFIGAIKQTKAKEIKFNNLYSINHPECFCFGYNLNNDIHLSRIDNKFVLEKSLIKLDSNEIILSIVYDGNLK